MTLVFNEPREGPATHALIIGVENPGSSEPRPFSAAVSAAAIADLLQELDFVDAPLASIDLIASHSPYTARGFFNRRDKAFHRPEPPSVATAGRAVRDWRERLNSDPNNLAFFYYVGGACGGELQLTLSIPGRSDAPELPDRGVDFANLWRGMSRNTAFQQLYFVDGWPLVTAGDGRVVPTKLLEVYPLPQPPVPRALYHAGIYQRMTEAPGGRPTPFSQAMTDALRLGEQISTRDLTVVLDAHYQDRKREADRVDGERVQAILDAAFDLRIYDPQTATVLYGKEGADNLRQRLAERALYTTPDQQSPRPSAIHPQQARGRQPSAPGEEKTKSREPKNSPRRLDIEARFARLTNQQIDYLRLVGERRTSKQIARDRKLSLNAVDYQIRTALQLLGINSRRLAAQLLTEWEGNRPSPERQSVPYESSPAISARDERLHAPEANTHFVSDDPEVERDELKRGPLAIALGRRLHRIWCRSNGVKVPGDDQFEAGGDERSAFVLHLDAPWGGGKTSFANFLARVLNPFPRGGTEPAQFLVERAGGAVGTIFIDDPPADGGEGGTAAQWPEDARRPWIVVQFNAWQAEHCTPPWWTFYQAIRKGCFAAVWAEGRSAARPAQASAPPRPLVEERIWSWAALWRRELLWRLRTPKVVARLATFAVAALALLILWRTNIIFRGDEGPEFNAGNALGFVLAGIGGISGLWGLGALFTESVAPGTDDLAERRSLGGGDPFERFRRHFGRTMAAVRRPVMVIVDDLDRCRPDFVVDLVRGIQTLLRSPRVVFVILGDRDWIERAFEAHHAAMSKVNVGPEQDFGARFVEKAIQMSFILPEMPEPSQDSYVRRVLIGPGANAAAADAPAPIAQQLRADYRTKVASAPTPEARKLAEDALVEEYRPQLEAAAKADATEAATLPGTTESDSKAPSAVAEAQAGKVLSEERALLAAVDEKMGQALLHRLEPLARFFPPNPRQIKRIVNAITMYTAVAYLQMEMDERDERGIELAIWVIIMTEWPKTWRVLASCPPLADVLAEADPQAALDGIEESALPGSREATLKEVNRIRADPDLLALITEASDSRPRLQASSVKEFVRLTPLYSRKQRLAEEDRQTGSQGESGIAPAKV